MTCWFYSQRFIISTLWDNYFLPLVQWLARVDWKLSLDLPLIHLDCQTLQSETQQSCNQQPGNTSLWRLLTAISKTLIATPAIYPRLVEFLHFNIQSTGQKSHCVNTVSGRRNVLFYLNSRISLVTDIMHGVLRLFSKNITEIVFYLEYSSKSRYPFNRQMFRKLMNEEGFARTF